MTRKECLDAAAGCVLKDRNVSYGGPENNFGRIALLWSDYLGVKLDEVDVAMLMSLLKIARIRNNKGYEDGFCDLAGYAACGAELADAMQAREDAVREAGDEYRRLKAEGCEDLVYDAPQTKEEVLERIRDVNPAIFKGFSE